MTAYRLRVLGGASVEGPHGPLTGRASQRHRLALLALLAATPRGGLTRDKLIALLWPDRTAERGRAALSDSVYRINKALGSEAIVAVGDELRLDRAVLPSDLDRFRVATERGEWREAVEAYGGAFLDGFHLGDAEEFEQWMEGERAALARAHADALESLADACTARGDRMGAAAVWERRAAVDPLDARVALRLMEALEAVGNRSRAIAHAGTHTRLLEHELGAAPNPKVVAYAEALRSRGDAPGPPGVQDGAADSPANAPDRERRAGPEGASAQVPVPPARATGRGTVRRPGWWAAAGVLAVAAGALAWGALSGSPDGAAPPTLAVLPFQDPAGDPQTRFVADGLTEDLLTSLSSIAGLRVTARSSVVAFRAPGRSLDEIAEALGVRYLLEGSVRRSGDELRVTARLVDTRTSSNAWAGSYDRRLEDVFEVQSDIARRIAGALEAELTQRVADRLHGAPTDDTAAYNAYLRGRFLWHRRTEPDLRAAAAEFEYAVEREPTFARAWAGHADALAVMAFYDYLPPDDAYPRAKASAERALDLDPELAEAHASLGYVALYHDWNAAAAEASFRRAVALNPSYSVGHQWYANLLVAMGRFDEAERSMGRAREVDPLSRIANGALAWVYYFAGRYDDAVVQADRALAMDSLWDLAHFWRGISLDRAGQGAAALEALARAVSLSGGSAITRAAMASAHARHGDVDHARDLLRELLGARAVGRYVPPMEIARIYAALDERGAALEWLRRSVDERAHSAVFMRVDPSFEVLRGDRRFEAIASRVGF